MYIALSVTTRRHKRLHHTWEADFVSGTFKLVEGLGIEILCCAQSKLARGEVANGSPVHGEVHRTGAWHHLHSQLLIVEEPLCAYCLYLRHYDVWLMFPYCRVEGIAVEH